jgi:cysteine-rich repeat protein
MAPAGRAETPPPTGTRTLVVATGTPTPTAAPEPTPTRLPGCGNGRVNPELGEQCDDGNLIDGDGCDYNCTFTACGNGIQTAGEQCDDANLDPNDGCTDHCTLCGNGTRTAPEECDDGNLDPDDGCTAACTRCGNGIATAPEGCDDGNLIDGDGCDSDCLRRGCGNGRTNGGEECDDAGVCAGGADTGSFCTAHTQCEGGECLTFGGDGCAANWTRERIYFLELQPERTSIAFQSGVFLVPPDATDLTGRLVLRLGRLLPGDPSGEVPLAVRTEDVQLDPFPIDGVGCLCLAGGKGPFPGLAGCGTIGCAEAGLDGVNLLTQIDHETGEVDPTCREGTVEAFGDCTDNVCVSGSNTGEACRASFDCGGYHDGVCNGPELVTPSGSGPPGSAVVDLHLVSRHFRSCDVEPNDPLKGADGVPCTADDPGVRRRQDVHRRQGARRTDPICTDARLAHLSADRCRAMLLLSRRGAEDLRRDALRDRRRDPGHGLHARLHRG